MVVEWSWFTNKSPSGSTGGGPLAPRRAALVMVGGACRRGRGRKQSDRQPRRPRFAGWGLGRDRRFSRPPLDGGTVCSMIGVLAEVAELADAPASGAGFRKGSGGSSPLFGTMSRKDLRL